ncbi:MAG TPA: Gfo/Idh/MocA family oxidoreductase, partial [Paenibacillus sp.]
MVRFGIIGTNWITERFIDAAMETERFELAAVYSRTEEKGRAFAAKYGNPAVYSEVSAMASSSEIDAVYIASPNSLHMEHAILCMDQGKHVLCEKPMASNVAEIRKMIEAAKRNNVIL